MFTSTAQQLSSLRRLYARAHQQLQEAGRIKIELEERIEALEAENRALREERDAAG